ncbi:hypothetical protein SH661x_002032 [Planctomicrobium sp. SH661]|uniref:hypothetical protein n=1 Tax=Planctomicrobium sp. SH661 TaxID=3448124 RepID=UPI003F5B18CC
MAAVLIIALMAQRNSGNTPQYSSRPGITQNANGRSVNSRRFFRVRNANRGFGSRFRRY